MLRSQNLWLEYLDEVVKYKDSQDCRKAKRAWMILDFLQALIIEDTVKGDVGLYEAQNAGVIEQMWVEVSPRWGKEPPQEPEKEKYHPSALPEIALPETYSTETNTCSFQ